MPNIDWSAEASSKKPGIYNAEVYSSVELEGRDSGQPYFLVTFRDVTDNAKICHDIVSFSPNAMSMSIAKLKALGFDKEKKQIQADELVGRRCRISVKVEHQEGYEPRLVVDISAKDGFRCGYKAGHGPWPLPHGTAGEWLEDHGASKPAAPKASKEELDDDIPF